MSINRLRWKSGNRGSATFLLPWPNKPNLIGWYVWGGILGQKLCVCPIFDWSDGWLFNWFLGWLWFNWFIGWSVGYISLKSSGSYTSNTTFPALVSIYTYIVKMSKLAYIYPSIHLFFIIACIRFFPWRHVCLIKYLRGCETIWE